MRQFAPNHSDIARYVCPGDVTPVPGVDSGPTHDTKRLCDRVESVYRLGFKPLCCL